MKNLSLAIALAIIIIFSVLTKANAQSDRVRVGIKAGLSLATLGSFSYSTLTYDYDLRPGFQGGIFLEVPISKAVLFSPQLLFTQRGGNVNGISSNGIILKGHTQVNYIDVPLLACLKAYPNLSFYVGPQVSFLVSEQYTLTIGKSTVSSTETTGTRKTNIGGNIGAGYNFTNNVSLNINCMVDFNHTFKPHYDGGERNSSFALTVGYKF